VVARHGVLLAALLVQAHPWAAVLWTIKPISARSRRSMTVVVSIASMSCRASAGSSAGVSSRRTMWRGPRTAAAGVVGMIWPMTSQSNKWRSAAKRSFAVGSARAFCNRSI